MTSLGFTCITRMSFFRSSVRHTSVNPLSAYLVEAYAELLAPARWPEVEATFTIAPAFRGTK